MTWKWVLEFSAPLRCRHPPDLSNPFSGKDNFSLFMSSHNRKSTVLGTFWTILTCRLRALYFAFKNTLWVHNYLPLRDEWFRSAGKLKKKKVNIFSTLSICLTFTGNSGEKRKTWFIVWDQLVVDLMWAMDLLGSKITRNRHRYRGHFLKKGIWKSKPRTSHDMQFL